MDNADNAFLCGQVTTDLNGEIYVGGSSDMVLIKVNSTGSVIWTRIVGTIGNDGAFGGKPFIHHVIQKRNMRLTTIHRYLCTK